jgi:hypothetical protein
VSTERLRELERRALETRSEGDVEAWAREAARRGDRDPLRLIRALREVAVLTQRQARLRLLGPNATYPRTSAGWARIDQRVRERLKAALRNLARLLRSSGGRAGPPNPTRILLFDSVHCARAADAALAYERNEREDRVNARRTRIGARPVPWVDPPVRLDTGDQLLEWIDDRWQPSVPRAPFPDDVPPLMTVLIRGGQLDAERQRVVAEWLRAHQEHAGYIEIDGEIVRRLAPAELPAHLDAVLAGRRTP